MIDYTAKLIRMIDAFLSGAQPFETFQSEYSRCFIDEVPELELTSSMADHYGAVHEKSEWTANSPTAEERAYGWIDVDEFRSWLRTYRESLRE